MIIIIQLNGLKGMSSKSTLRAEAHVTTGSGDCFIKLQYSKNNIYSEPDNYLCILWKC